LKGSLEAEAGEGNKRIVLFIRNCIDETA